MAENVYLLKVANNAAGEVDKRLGTSSTPSHVRVSTLAPLSNYGYPPGAEGSVLGVGPEGLIVGAEDDDNVPRAFVPWQNVSYIADGSSLAGS